MADSSAVNPPELAIKGCRVIAGARLHFGLLDTETPFGGAGVMIETPATIVQARVQEDNAPSTIIGAQQPRIAAILQRCLEIAPHVPKRPLALEVLASPESHTGLGSGTQLSLAAAEAIRRCWRLSIHATELAAEIAARGKRSAVGIHGFFHGGMIMDQPSRAEELNRMAARVELPEEWKVVLLTPQEAPDVIWGVREVRLFEQLPRPLQSEREALRKILAEELFPSAEAKDFACFSNALHRYNRGSGQFYASVQGGPFYSASAQHLVDRLKAGGIEGVGQSSWGPTIFVFCKSAAMSGSAIEIAGPAWRVLAISKVHNHGYRVEEEIT